VIKKLTGGDPIVARFMRENFFEFMPQFKVWLVANEPPRVNALDGGIRRRVRMVPFEAEFTGNDRDDDLARKLAAEAPGILAWAIRGCLDWQRDGLGSCSKVEQATEGYLTTMNPLHPFIDAGHCRLNPRAQTQGGPLRQAYENWCIQSGARKLSTSEYAAALEALGCEKWKAKTGAVWSGIELLDLATQTTLSDGQS
jgi:putative DNA primase/helicase